MKINPQYSGTGPVRTRIARGAMMAAILCAGTLTVYSALAQEGVESAALMKGGASAPAAVAKGPMQMTISMA
ncbi:secretin, partial [Paraburkholderia sp. SIMBA_049]